MQARPKKDGCRSKFNTTTLVLQMFRQWPRATISRLSYTNQIGYMVSRTPLFVIDGIDHDRAARPVRVKTYAKGCCKKTDQTVTFVTFQAIP